MKKKEKIVIQGFHYSNYKNRRKRGYKNGRLLHIARDVGFEEFNKLFWFDILIHIKEY